MTDPDLLARQAQSVLDNDAFRTVCKELTDRALQEIVQGLTLEALLAARAKLLVVSEIQNHLGNLVTNHQFTQARPARKPLA